MSVGDNRADVSVIGDGVIGLSIARAFAAAGLRCRIYGKANEGMASAAAAGLLAPSIGTDLPPAVRRFFDASLDSYDSFLAELRDIDSELALLRGLIEVRHDSAESESRSDRRIVSAEELAALEPAVHLTARQIAVLHPTDAAIDNVRLLRALRAVVAASPHIVRHEHPAGGLRIASNSVTIIDAEGAEQESATAVIAAGAWSPQLDGLPRPLPVLPLKGQMLAVGASVLRHAVMSDNIYLVPRSGETVIGATAERARFNLSVSDGIIEALRLGAVRICPALSDAPVVRRWAGIRPATPDMLPVIGADPDHPSLVYACGHSKNGILLAPATARAVVELVLGLPQTLDIAAFSVARFG